MTLDEAIEKYTSNAEYERTHGSLQGCMEFRQLAEWLKELKRLKEQEHILDKIRLEIETERNAGCHTQYAGGLDFDLSIIDKYKAESEE